MMLLLLTAKTPSIYNDDESKHQADKAHKPHLCFLLTSEPADKMNVHIFITNKKTPLSNILGCLSCFYLLLLTTSSMFTLTDFIRSAVRVALTKAIHTFQLISWWFLIWTTYSISCWRPKYINKAGTREHEEMIIVRISGLARHNLGSTLSQRVECVSWRTQHGAGPLCIQVAWKSSVYCPGRSHGEAETALRSGCWFTCERHPHIN